MAYTNTPMEQSQRTVNIPVDAAVSYRNGDVAVGRDAAIVNAYYDRISQTNQERFNKLKKRPGIAVSAYSLNKVAAPDTIRGHFYDSAQNAFYWATSNRVMRLRPDVSATPTLIQTLATSAGQVDFISYLKSDNSQHVLFTDGITLYAFNINTAVSTAVTDPDLPSPHEPSLVYLNGYVGVIKKNTGDIYTCVNDDFLSWLPGDFITAEMSSDFLVKLARTRNYIVAFGVNSMEHFYDAGNATGSPLQRQDSAFTNIGYITGLAQIGDSLIFVGQRPGEKPSVYLLDAFEAKKISNEVVDRTLEPYSTTNNIKGNANLNIAGFPITVDGHIFYLLRTSTTTWVFDATENLWYEWRSGATGLQVEASWNMLNGNCYIATAGQSSIAHLSTSVGTDYGSTFSSIYTSPSLHFGSIATKFMSQLTAVVDQPQTTGTSGTDFTVAWSDNDGLTFSPARSINIFSERPTTFRLGRFRRRMFRITYTGTVPSLSLYRLEAEIDIGVT